MLRMPSRLCAALVAALALAAGSGAHATQVRQLDTRGLTLDSHDIVIGEVESVAARWNEARTKILTDVTVRVTRSLKGAGAGTLRLVQLGGTVGDVRTTVPGSPAFLPGEQALLFVWRDARGTAQVNGLAQGKFDIHRDPGSGELTVQRTLPGLAVRDARRLALVPDGEASPRVLLADLVAEIERVLAEAGR